MQNAPDLREMTLSAAIEPIPATIRDDATLSQALGKMREKGLHELAVLDAKGRLVGLVSDETLLKRRRLPLQTSVANILVVPPRLTTKDTLAKGAEALLANGFRELPVYEAGTEKLAGQVTRWKMLEILRKQPDICALAAHEVMTPNPVVVKEDDTIDYALERMRQLDEPTIPVVEEEGILSGVVSARDILRVYAGWTVQKRVPKGSPSRERKTHITVEGIMTTPVVEAPRDALVGSLIDQMLEAKASSVVITEKSKPVGIVTKGDLLEMIASYEPREGVFIQITGLEGHDPFIIEDLFSEVDPMMKKLALHVRPLTFNLHVMEHHRAYGHRVECRARLLTDRGLFTATEEDDDILRAAVGVLENIEKQVVREKDRRRPSPRKARAGWGPGKRARAL